MAKTLEERVNDLETGVSILGGEIIKLGEQVARIAETVESSEKKQVEFVKKVNEDQRETIKFLNNIKDKLLLASVEGHKPS